VKKVLLTIVSVAGALVACGPVINGSLHSTYAPSNVGAGYNTPTSTQPVGVLPSPSDFKIKVLITKQDCFGTAGCNIEYEIDPIFTGSETLTTKTFRVIYEIDGGDSPKSDSFTVTDGRKMHYDKTGSISTSGSGSGNITATPTQVVAEDS
jgi:hypothetical protein